jgi:hypothetical protein
VPSVLEWYQHYLSRYSYKLRVIKKFEAYVDVMCD